MYPNSIRRPTPNRHQQFFIRRSEIAFDKRVEYIESVCAILIESRFGPDCVARVTIDMSDRPELDPSPLYDLFDEEPIGQVPFYALSLQGRAVYQLAEAEFLRAKQMALLAAGANGNNITANSSSNQGRGSPRLSGTHVLSSVANGD